MIGPDKKVKLVLVYPMTTGRNFDEVLRVIDSLQLTAKHKVATPVNWKQGENVIIAGSVNNDEAKEIFGELERAQAVHPHRPATRLARSRRGRGGEEPRRAPRRSDDERAEQLLQLLCGLAAQAGMHGRGLDDGARRARRASGSAPSGRGRPSGPPAGSPAAMRSSASRCGRTVAGSSSGQSARRRVSSRCVRAAR